ncbi:hypothetical protein KP509_03G069900 [Ceratopteris richardii]|uniref:Nudix hydrolase domain-containing protein n=1 Tax=Ceratopteris richardii TaxID=49495 RepID=A0A8T2V4F1_CERRI|nr:hypothetical protein KP509_03G069900 [Ceratopteris richardii]
MTFAVVLFSMHLMKSYSPSKGFFFLSNRPIGFMRTILESMFQSCAALRPYIAKVNDIYKDFTSYKVRVPVTGAIILDEFYEKCLLVKGWKAGASWSFPRGKKNKDEEDHKCAIREVWEETGFDVSELIKVEDDIEVVIAEQRIRLFIIGGVSESIAFAPRTKNEISDIAWHRIEELPMSGNESSSRGTSGMKYYMVAPFIGPLKSWIAHRKPSMDQILDTLSRGSTFEAQASEQVDEYRRGFRNFKFDYASILQKLDSE